MKKAKDIYHAKCNMNIRRALQERSVLDVSKA